MNAEWTLPEWAAAHFEVGHTLTFENTTDGRVAMVDHDLQVTVCIADTSEDIVALLEEKTGIKLEVLSDLGEWPI